MKCVVAVLIVASAVLPIAGLGLWLVRSALRSRKRRDVAKELEALATAEDDARADGDREGAKRMAEEFQACLRAQGYRVRYMDVDMLPVYVLNAVDEAAGTRPWWEFGFVAIGLLCGMAAALLVL